jgi:hypothetical protein
MRSSSARASAGSSTEVCPIVTTCRGPRTVCAGLIGTTWPLTSQSNRCRNAASRCLTLGAASSRVAASIHAATCTGWTAAIDADLNRFTGSERWYRHSLNRDVLYTDGAKYVADEGGASWLLDEIALAQRYEKAVAAQEFQVWTLTVKDDRSAALTFEDGNNKTVFEKAIPFTDFPAERITFWFENSTIYLPSEH